MKIVCIGGGPAGLYFAILKKILDPGCEIVVYERNPPNVTHGWGVYCYDLVEQLQAWDPESATAIREGSMRWTDQVLLREGRRTTYSGRGGYSIGRHRLLDVLATRATALGVEIRYESPVDDLGQLPPADLIVASDGSGSIHRKSAAERFGTRIATGRNKFIWLGTTKVLDAFTFALENTPAGWIWFHGYAHDAETSTCVVECSPETWQGLGFEDLDIETAVRSLGEIFARALDGHPLMAGGSSWANFRTVTNESWHDGNVVLIGDAAHTTHFTIGSGTRLALMDAISLCRHLQGSADIEAALAAYGEERREALRQPRSEARVSAEWFETIHRYMGLSDRQFFLLLRERRSPLLARIPPRVYYGLHMAVEKVPLMRRLRSLIGPPARAAYSRWRS